jgi:hypothetical protein
MSPPARSRRRAGRQGQGAGPEAVKQSPKLEAARLVRRTRVSERYQRVCVATIPVVSFAIFLLIRMTDSDALKRRVSQHE